MDLLGIVAFLALVIGTILGAVCVAYFVEIARRLVKLIDALTDEIEHKTKSDGIVFKE